MQDFGFILSGGGGSGPGTNYWSIAGSNITPNTGSGIVVNNSTVNGLADFNAAINYKVQALNTPQASDTYNVASTDYIISVGSGVSASLLVNLPSSPAVGRTLYVKDDGIEASLFPITINAGANNIDGSPTFVLSNDYQGVELAWNGFEWMVVSDANASTPVTSYWTPLAGLGIEYTSGGASSKILNSYNPNYPSVTGGYPVAGASFYDYKPGYYNGETNVLFTRIAIWVDAPTSILELDYNTTGFKSVDFSSITLYYTGSSDTFATSTPIATNTAPYYPGWLSISPALSMTAGINYFWVAGNAIADGGNPYFLPSYFTTPTYAYWIMGDAVSSGIYQNLMPLVQRKIDLTTGGVANNQIIFGSASEFVLGTDTANNGTAVVTLKAPDSEFNSGCELRIKSGTRTNDLTGSDLYLQTQNTTLHFDNANSRIETSKVPPPRS